MKVDGELVAAVAAVADGAEVAAVAVAAVIVLAAVDAATSRLMVRFGVALARVVFP